MEHITVKLNDFEGPFDLLFHLIKKNKMDIRDIQVAVLTEQYMEYIFAAKNKDMENMSEFLLMAATLLELKCRLLFPMDSEEDGDLRKSLMDMLEEYKKFKEAADLLKEKEAGAIFYIFKEKENAVFELLNYEEDEYDNLTIENIQKAFMEAMRNRKAPVKIPSTGIDYISKDTYSAKQKMEYIRGLLKKRRRIKLSALFMESSNKEEMAAVFQGVLLLVKENSAKVAQEQPFGEVLISGDGR